MTVSLLVLVNQRALPLRIFLTAVIISSTILPTFNSKIIMGNETDRLSLIAFKAEITHDPLGVLSSWNDSAHFCDWSGVTCGRGHGRVNMLDLSSSRLTGGLSPHVGNLSFLRILKLEANSFTGDIPQEIGRLSQLQHLQLTNNTFSGEIPINISHCSNLRFLELGGNKLTGKLHEELSFLSKLETFAFYRNNVSGRIPSSFGNLSLLDHFACTFNQLTGVIPDTLGRLKKLTFLTLGANLLSGEIPSSLYNLSSLNTFSVSFNRLEGTLPSDLGLLLPNVEIFDLAENRMHGPLPVTISNASRLSVIQIGSNNFSGNVPFMVGLNNLTWAGFEENNLGNGDDDLSFLTSLVNCSKLEVLQLNDNNFLGPFPEYFSNFSTSLRQAAFGRNQITGRIPLDIGNLIGLEVLALESNQLTGAIPSSLGELPRLIFLFLNVNELSGSIPFSLGNLTSLLHMYMALNYFNGSIPASLGNLRKLLDVNLAKNRLTGTIPKELMSLTSLLTFSLSNNLLTGSIPLEISELENLGALDFSNNQLSGEIPATLGSCISLERLYLEGNSLGGNIPRSLSSLRAVQILDLSRNNFSGKIPDFLGSFRLLKRLNLSFNDFEGAVPTQGAFQNASAVSLLENKKLCGGTPQLKLPECTSNGSGTSGRHKSSTRTKIVIAFPSGLLLVGLILLLLFYMFYRSGKTRNKMDSTSAVGLSFPRITYGDLFKATDGFSPSNLIGSGGFGSVYKGFLHQDESETAVAVKVLNLRQKGALKSFIAECEALRGIRHRNLVKTLTVCSSTDFSGNDFKALVYEFMAKGSLDKWLHRLQTESQDQLLQLNLSQRLNIAIDVACAVDYLHNQCSQHIVHRDIKPSNVLLDDDMTACIGDFGLARILLEASDNSSSNQASSAGFRGSIGYAAPEYAISSEVSTYGDIYSYGILLLEMFTGKRPTDEMFKDGLNLRSFVDAALSEGVLPRIVDPILLQERQGSDTSSEIYQNRNNIRNDEEKFVQCLVSLFRIGLACSADMPRDRMNITDVVAQLSSIRDKFLGAAMRHRQ